MLCISLMTALAACGRTAEESGSSAGSSSDSASSDVSLAKVESDREYIEQTLNLSNNADQEWSYSSTSDSWTLSVVSAVAYPEIAEEEGVSVCVPGAYVIGVDTDGNGIADVTSEDGESFVKGSLVIDYDAEITSENGQVYTAATAPVILNTGAAGYSSSTNTTAADTYAADGYINVACGNRGKQDTATDENGNSYYTGDAPSCLADQKAAARFVKYNILLGNLPGNVDYFVSTGGSGGGAHAVMFAATSNNPDFYDYQIAVGAVGVYQTTDGTYTTTVTIDGTDYDISDGAWGCIAYSPITSLYEADMAMAFEYYMDTAYQFSTPFQAQLAEYLSTEYMDYINGQNLSVQEGDVGFDLNGDGDQNDEIALTIEYDPDTYPDTNGYYGSYLDLYVAEFEENLQWYLDNLDYAEGWTWFDAEGNALEDAEVAALTTKDKAEAFLEGRYAKASESAGTGNLPSGMNGASDFPDSNPPDNLMTESTPETGIPAGGLTGETSAGGGDQAEVGTPDVGTTQSSTGGTDSANYSTYEEMVEAYQTDIDSLNQGDEYGNNILSLYNPLNYINAEGTENPTWIRMMMGASEGDMSLFSSLNLQIAFLNAGVDADVKWQWDGGHVPSEILGESFSLYLDEMYGNYVSGANSIVKPAAAVQTENGTAVQATGTNLSSWVEDTDLEHVSFSLSDAAAYRTAGASKAIPGFDVIDYGQENYVFGNSTQDARHWDQYLLDIFEEYADVLEPLFNLGSAET